MKGSIGASAGPGVGARMSSGSIETGSRGSMVSMPKSDTKAGPQINIKNGIEGPQKVATDSALRFKAEGAKPTFNLEQKAIKFAEKKPNSHSQAAERRVNKAANIRLSYTRQELGKLMSKPSIEPGTIQKHIEKSRLIEIPKQRSENSRQNVYESYLKSVGKFNPEKTQQRQRESKKTNSPELKTIMRQKVQEAVAKMKTRVELQRSKKSLKAETKVAPLSTEKYQQVLFEKVQAKVKTQNETRNQDATKTLTEQQNKTHAKVEVQTHSEKASQNASQPETQGINLLPFLPT